MVGKREYTVENSARFVQFLREQDIDYDEEMVSIHVNSLCTSRPIQESLAKVKTWLEEDRVLSSRPLFTTDEID